MITFRGGRVPEPFRRSPCSVVAALVPPAEQMAKRSLEIQRRVIKVKASRQKSSSFGCSATSKELTVELISRKDAIRCEKGRRTQGRHRVIDCISRFHQESRSHIKKEGQIWKVVIGCQKENGRMWSFGRNESQNPNAQPSGDRFPSTLTKVGDVRNLLTAGVNLNWSLSTKVKENHTERRWENST